MLRGVLKAACTNANARYQKDWSLALPALGTGNLRYPKEEACHCMFETFVEMGRDPNISRKFTVNIVMHARDHDLIEVMDSL